MNRNISLLVFLTSRHLAGQQLKVLPRFNFLYNGSQPSINGSPRNLQNKFGVGSIFWKLLSKIFLPYP